MKRLDIIFALIAVFLLNACQPSNPSKTEVPKVDVVVPTIKITVSNQGEVTISGKPVQFDSIQPVLESELKNLRTIPETIPVQYGEEVLMGTRGEVATRINDAITAAKTARKN